MQNLQRARLQVQHADLARVDDRSDGVERSAVILLLELAVFHESLAADVFLELRPADEVVILTVDLAVAFGSTRICAEKRVRKKFVGSLVGLRRSNCEKKLAEKDRGEKLTWNSRGESRDVLEEPQSEFVSADARRSHQDKRSPDIGLRVVEGHLFVRRYFEFVRCVWEKRRRKK